jgi:hypothetical protein
MVKHILFTILFLGFYSLSEAQYSKSLNYDTTYYRSFKGTIITRVFFSRDYDIFKMKPPGGLPVLAYHANTALNIGVGLTYRSFFFSISKGLNFLQSDQTKGPTNSLSVQAHLYRRKWVFDALAEFNKGFFLTPHGLGSPDGQTYYKRPDLNIQIAGISAFRILNSERFSYGAGLSQNAWQQKSAGSFLIGAQAFYTSTRGDSALAPSKTPDTLIGQLNIHTLHCFEIGPGIGYAYTFVYERHYFLIGSLNLNCNLSYSREIGISDAGKFSISPNYFFRLGAGYNASRWGASLSWFAGEINSAGESSGYQYRFTSGSYRLVYARRIAINHQMKKILETGTD